METVSQKPEVASPELREERVVALLRTPYLAALSEIDARLRPDFPDLRPAHFIVFQMVVQPPGGSRLTDLARRARMTKPSMLELVDALERGGYLERVPDPRDRRAKLIRLTAHGAAAYERGFQAVDQLEASWAARLGSDRFALLLALLRDLMAALGRGDKDPDDGGPASDETVLPVDAVAT